MSKYLTTSGSFFEPFSYDELVKPLVQATEAHNAAQENYDKLALDTQSLARYIGDGDVKAKKLYDDYMSKLQALQDDLYTNGYNGKTARNLSAARNAYASDITRLAAAIKSRQERSTEYWDARMKDKDLVVGEDPALSSLDKYMADDNYGRDWYKYSGTAFAKEVEDEAKNLGKQLFDQYGRRTLTDSEAPEYYLSRIQFGFSGEEINRAFGAVRNSIKNGLVNDDYSVDKRGLTKEEGALADSIMSHMVSSGALQTKDAGIIEQMLRYAKAGASGAIGDTNVNYLKKDDDFGSGSGRGNGNSYDLYLQTAGEQYIEGDKSSEAFSDINSYLHKNFDPKKEETKVVNLNLRDKNGELVKNVPFRNQSDIDSQAYHNVYRTNAISNFGLDPAYGEGQIATIIKNDNPVRVSTKKIIESDLNDELRAAGFKKGDIGVFIFEPKSQKWVIGQNASIKFRDAKKNYDAYIERLKADNPDIDDYAITPKEEAKLRERYGIDANLPFEYLEETIKAKNMTGAFVPAVFVGENTPDKIKEKVVNQLRGTHTRNGANETYMYRKINKAGNPEGKYLSFDDVFDDKLKHYGLISITALPNQYGQDLLQVNTAKGSFVVNSHAFHNNLYSQIDSSLNDYTASDGSVVPGLTEFIADESNPERVFMMTPAQDRAYTRRFWNLVNPNTSDDILDKISMKKILRSKKGRDWVYNLLIEKMNARLGAARDEIANLGEKVASETGNSYMGE